MSHQLIQKYVSLFRVKGETPGFLSRNIVIKIVCTSLRDNALARCESIFPLLRCQGVWNKMCTQLPPSLIPFQNQKIYSLVDVRKFCYHS